MEFKVLKLYSANLRAQIQFYEQTIGLRLLKKTAEEAHFQVGKTQLLLVQQPKATSYHIAINIPANQMEKALVWLKKKVAILRYSELEIQEFAHWNAKAIYFYDADRNIVELIARKNLLNDQKGDFDQGSLLEIAEIGVPVDSLDDLYQQLQAIVYMPIYDGSLHKFCAMGDENALLICIDKNKKKWVPTNDTAHASPFELIFEQGQKNCHLRFDQQKIQLMDS